MFLIPVTAFENQQDQRLGKARNANNITENRDSVRLIITLNTILEKKTIPLSCFDHGKRCYMHIDKVTGSLGVISTVILTMF